MLNLTYEYKLILTSTQTDWVEQILEVCRKVWNYALRERKDWSASRKSPADRCSLEKEYIISPDEPYPNYNRQAKRLTEARKENEELKSVHSQVLQQVLRTLDRSVLDMKAKGLGFPRFKNRYRMRSFLFPQLSKNCLKGNHLKLPQIGWVKFRKSREIPERFVIKQARIVRRASGYYVLLSLQMDVSIPDTPFQEHSIGIDLGLDKFLATSDGLLIERPRFLNQLQRELKLLQRRLRNKKKGSKNRDKLNQKIAKLHETISNVRKDWHFKLAHQLCDQAQSIFLEDIDFRSWGKGMFSKHCLDAGFGQFVTLLKWVAWKRGVFVAEVDKNYSSQICPNCGELTGKKPLSEREHNCPHCGYKTHRDVAAAQVIRDRGIEKALGHGVSENACGDGLTGTETSSQESVKQEILNVSLRIPNYTA